MVGDGKVLPCEGVDDDDGPYCGGSTVGFAVGLYCLDL